MIHPITNGQSANSSRRLVSSDSGEADGQLQHALEAYVEEIEAYGRTDQQAFLARFPHLANELASHLEGIDLMFQIGATEQQSLKPLSTLGDFRIVREIGRGGMGVVYEAEQLSLGRAVALKVLPFAAVLDDRAIARFRNEAKAAATLDHPNIVPIYAVGSDRGVYYYAMSLINGLTLAQVVDDLQRQATTGGVRPFSVDDVVSNRIEAYHQTEEHLNPHGIPPKCQSMGGSGDAEPGPSCDTSAVTWREDQAMLSTKQSSVPTTHFRRVAQIGIQAAEALHHAHEQGIVHRDVKPGNLILDGNGKLWVTDFGLAHVEGDAGLTATGDLLGTLRYMAPERALAQRVVVDHRADVYSLGVTLYELLTLHPAFDGLDRDAVLKQMAFEEARKPRQLDRSIPVDLETITLKAMAKEPDDRYQSCQEVADDLRHFLAKKPIQARPASLSERVGKWSRRHRSLVFASLSSFVVLFLVVLVATGLLAQAWQSATTASAEHREQLLAARSNLYRAHVNIAKGNWEDGNLDATHGILDEFLPQPGYPDLRRWEWYFLKSLCHRDLQSIRGSIVKGASADQPPWLSTREGDVLLLREFGETDVKLQFAAPDRGNLRDVLVRSPDGKRLLYANSSFETHDSVLQLWDLATRRKLKEIPSVPMIMDAAWSPDGQKFVTAHHSEEIRVWDASSFVLAKSLPGVQGYGIVRSIAWSPDGAHIAAGGNISGFIGIWNARTGTRLYRMDAHSALVGALAFSPDGLRLVSGSTDQRLKLWNVKSGAMQLEWMAHRGHVNDVSWTPDGAKLATFGSDSLVKIWRAANGQLLNVLRERHSGYRRVHWLDNAKFATSAADGTRMWRSDQEQRTQSIPAKGKGAWSPSGGHLYFVSHGSNGPLLQVFNAKTGAFDSHAMHDAKVNAAQRNVAAISSSGRRLAVGNLSGTVSLWDLATRNLEFTIDAHPGHEVRDVQWSPDESLLATACLGDGFKIWDPETGTEIVALDSERYLNGASAMWSPDGSQLATLSFDHDVRIWDVATWRERHRLGAELSGGWSSPGWSGLSWNPTGDRLAARYGGGRLVVWDTHTGQQLLGIRGHTSNVRAIAWSPDGSRLASGGEDHTVKIWNADTGEDLMTLRDHKETVWTLGWSPDGLQLVAGGHRQTIWDAAAGYERYR